MEQAVLEKQTAGEKIRKLLNKQEFSVFGIIFILTVFAWAMNHSFLTWNNIASILRANSFQAIIALGMTFAFIAGELDLSIGSVVAFSGMVTGELLLLGTPLVIAAACGLLSGLLCGMATGFAIVQFNIPPMIGSLGTQFILRGIVYVVTSGNSISPMPRSFEILGVGSFLGMPVPMLIWIVLGVMCAFILHKTTYGRSVYAIGGNKDTAWLCGIRVKWHRMSTYWMTGILSGVAGVLLCSRLSSAQPNAGTGWEMNVIAAVVVGGTSTGGGIGTIIGTVLGSILIGMLQNVLVMMKVSAYWQNIAIGSIILISVIFDQYRKHSSTHRRKK